MVDIPIQPHSTGTKTMFEERAAEASPAKGQPAAPGVAGWLSLAAAPTFAMMALISAVGQPDMICSAVHDTSPLTGMVPMYLLMSAFHLTPWLKLVPRRRG